MKKNNRQPSWFAFSFLVTSLPLSFTSSVPLHTSVFVSLRSLPLPMFIIISWRANLSWWGLWSFRITIRFRRFCIIIWWTIWFRCVIFASLFPSLFQGLLMLSLTKLQFMKSSFIFICICKKQWISTPTFQLEEKKI